MRSINSLPLKNIVKKPARSFALILISAFLALSAFGGTVMVMSLSGGLDSLSARLGADIIVTPYAATSQVSYDSVIIQGKPGQFYMDSKYYEEIKTGTELDSALYVDIDTMKELIRAHNEKNPNQEKKIDPDNVVSSVLIKVADGYDIDDVVGDINLHVRQVKAIRTQNMISDVSDSLSGVSATVSVLMVVVWILSVVILAIVFTMIINERKKEFAVLRVLGASRAKLAGLVFCEAALYGFFGSLLGSGFTVFITALFSSAIENAIGLPFLLPSALVMLIVGAATVALTVAASAVTAAVSAVKISKIDTGLILRGDN